jgi:hypothetical protein
MVSHAGTSLSSKGGELVGQYYHIFLHSDAGLKAGSADRFQPAEILRNVTYNTVADFINVLPGNGSINTVQHAILDQQGYANRF